MVKYKTGLFSYPDTWEGNTFESADDATARIVAAADIRKLRANIRARFLYDSVVRQRIDAATPLLWVQRGDNWIRVKLPAQTEAQHNVYSLLHKSMLTGLVHMRR